MAVYIVGRHAVEQLPFDQGQGAMDDVAGDRVEGHAPEPHPPERLGEVHLTGSAVIVGTLFGPVRVGEHLPEIAVSLEVHEPPRAGRLQQLRVIGLELVACARGAHTQQGDQVGAVDLTRRPRVLHRRQGAQGAGVTDPLPGRLDRQPLLTRQPRGAGLRARVVPHPIGVPPGQQPRLGGFELGAQALRQQDRLGQLGSGEPVRIERTYRGGRGIEQRVGVGHDRSSFGRRRSRTGMGTSNQVPKGKPQPYTN